MIKRLKEKWLLSILTIISFSVALSQVALVFDVENTTTIWLFIGGLSIVAGAVPYFIIRLLFYVPVYLMCLYSLSFSGYVYSFTFFLTDWIRSLAGFATAQSTEHYSLVMMSIILLVSILIVEWQISSETITPQMLFFVGYLLLLNEFNDMSVTMPILVIVSIYLLERVIISSDKLLTPSFFISLALVGLVTGSSLYMQSTEIKNTLISASAPLRKELDKKGLYEYINAQKFRFMATSGFGEDDSVLGGPIKDDDSLVFDVRQATSRYWRVDSKMTYTGKGWENTDSGIPTYKEATSLTIEPEGYTGQYNTPEEVTLHFYNRNTYLPLSYGKIEIPENPGNVTFKYYDTTQRVNMNKVPDYQDISMIIATPNYDESQLKQADIVVPDEQYLQLPENFPQKIQDLTLEITKGKKTLYDKVNAVESYLKMSTEYHYSKSAARHTPENSDYVEYFLFESKVGYCDNFSTAMSVMLRSIGIPTRWAKGFSQGQIREKTQNETIYNIRNSDAHSWVEVYFEGSGWVPFEPTPSFAGTQNNETENNTTETSPSSSEKNKDNMQPSTSTSSTESLTVNTKQNKESIWRKISKFFEDNQRVMTWIMKVIIGLVAVVCLIVGIKYRYVISLWFVIHVLHWPFTKVYTLLLRQLETLLTRQDSVSLSQYSADVSSAMIEIGTTFSEFTKQYEKIVYGQEKDMRLDSLQINDVLRLSKQIVEEKRTPS
ncbi:transglutaminase-like domain-containing protein [Vagococcus bubulae]|uniref:Transglutaminase-like domain-containing protein n=1 Tax=Vagococcus bubulae TaxID=1977868 RepID=A0A429ZEY4_9ENTE|nr:transglutaminase domain-containing protein [Vagococcus bubulae]RST92204.1 hypothetical protein CBF36_08945 [Vagococcus bubulae]